MKKENGFSLIVLIITIVVIIILAAITMTTSNNVVDNAVDSKFKAEATIDDNKIREIMTYELAGTKDVIDTDIDLMRIELKDDLIVQYKEKEYGNGYALYLSERDIDKVSKKTSKNNLKPFMELTRSYVVNYVSGDYTRLVDEWNFKN